MFGTKKEEAKKEVPSFEQMRAMADADALELESEVLAKAPEYLAKYKKKYQDQLVGFEFSCERFYDFLFLKVTRKANEFASDYRGPAHWATAINLGLVKRISKYDGSPVSDDGKLSYKGGYGMSSYSDKLEKETVQPDYPHFYDYADFVGSHRYHDAYSPIYGRIIMTPNHTTKFPVESMDDTIEFVGANIFLRIPYSLGDSVLMKILTELGRFGESIAQ